MKTYRIVLLSIAAVLFALFFASCTTDLDPDVMAPNGIIYTESQFDSLVNAGVIDTSGAAKKKSSSSVAVSSSSGEETESSSATEESSSSEAGESSSSEDDDEEISSSSEPESSSSYEATFGEHESIVAKDGVLKIGVDAMTDVDDEYAEDLEQVKASIEDSGKSAPDGYRNFGVESTTEEFNYDAYLENAFFCLDKEGTWFEISRTKLAEFIPHFKNGADLGPLEGFKVSFADACASVYAKLE